MSSSAGTGIALVVLASAAAFYWTSREVTTEQIAPIQQPAVSSASQPAVSSASQLHTSQLQASQPADPSVIHSEPASPDRDESPQTQHRTPELAAESSPACESVSSISIQPDTQPTLVIKCFTVKVAIPKVSDDTNGRNNK